MPHHVTTHDRFKKMREIYSSLGPVYGLDGEAIFAQQNPDWVDANIVKEENEDYFYEANENQNHFTSQRQDQGYQALRNKNPNYRIRERGNHHVENPYQQQTNQLVPDEYKHDPDLYYALQASLGSVNEEIRLENNLNTAAIDFENSGNFDDPTIADNTRKTPSTAEHASPFVSKTLS